MPQRLLTPGLHDLAAGHIANVVTYLEMTSDPQLEVPPPHPDLKLERWLAVDQDAYFELFKAVGEPWLWSGRLRLSKNEVRNLFEDPQYQLYQLRRNEAAIGLLELDFRVESECEFSYFGLVGEAVGQGIGKWFMMEALRHAWRTDITRVWLHTCTLDHPKALGFYQSCGFVPYLRQVEVDTDPRSAGLLDPSAAPTVPIL